MAKKLALLVAAMALVALAAAPGAVAAPGAASRPSCRGGWSGTTTCALGPREVIVVHSEIPFPTERFMRIGYTLAVWAFQDDGLDLRRIEILDGRTGRTLQVLSGGAIPALYRAGEEQPPGSDPIVNDFLSIQLPIPLGQPLPAVVTHRLVFRDAGTGRSVVVKGGTFRPRTAEKPVVLQSPIRGRNLAFVNQSTNGYHFDVLMFMDGTIREPEHFASDIIAFDDLLRSMSAGDRGTNETYHVYDAPIHAVADGTVVAVRDGFVENHGGTPNPAATFDTLDDYAGDYVILDIGGGRFAGYMHCRPGSFMVKTGDRVRAGDVLARVGNSGNSGGPHLHFQVTDRPTPFGGRGVPFVLEQYTKVGEFSGSPISATGIRTTPQVVRGAMMEETTAVDVP